jgi:predicted RND superfamily exporter protein
MNFDKWITKYADFVIKWRVAVVVVCLGVAGVMGSFAGRLAFDTNYRIWFEEDDAYLKSYDAFLKEFGNDDMFVVAFKDDAGLFNPKAIGAIGRLTERFWQISGVIRVDSLTNAQSLRGEPDGIAINELFPKDQPLTADAIARSEKYVESDRMIRGLLISHDKKLAVIRGKFAPNSIGPELPPKVYRELTAILKEETSRTGYRFYMAGGPLTDAAFDRVAESDMSRLVPPLLLMLAVILVVVFRSIWGMLIPLGCAFLTITTTMGLTGLMGYKLNAVTASTPQILLGIGIAGSVHILAAFLSAKSNGLSSADAVRVTLRENMGPVFLTEFTTALAFYSYYATPLVPIQRLGFMAGHGTMIMFIFSMTLTPAALTFFPDKRKVKTDYNKPHAYFRAIGNYMLGRPRTVVLLWAGLALVAAGFMRHVHVDSDPVNYFSPSYWFRQSVDFIEKQGSGAAVYEIVVRGDGPGSIKTAAYMRELDRLDRYLREEAPGELVATMSISGVVRKINTALHGDDPAYDAIPGDDAAVSQYLFLYGLSVPVGQDLNDRINVDASATRLTAVRHLVSTQTSRQNIDQITNWAQANLHNVTVEFTGRDVLYTNMGNNITKGLVDSFSLALLSIMLVMFVTFRSFKCAIVGLIVNVVPLLLTLGLMGVFRITLDVGTIMVADLGLGIAVDDTIHFLSHYRRQMRKGSTARAAILEMFGQLGTPLFVTTTVLVGSFMVFVFADFMPNFYFGVLISALIVIALLVELSLTPAMLYLWDRKRGEEETVAEPAVTWSGHPAPALGGGIECARD